MLKPMNDSNIAFQSAMTTFINQQSQPPVIASTSIATPVNHSASVHSVSRSTPSVPRVCNPRCFNSKIEVEPFLNGIKDCLFLQHNALSTNKDKCCYTGLYLAGGSPVEWFTNVKRNNPALLQHFTQFIVEFRSKFSDPHLQSPVRKLDNLCQANSAFTYLTMEVLKPRTSEANPPHFVYLEWSPTIPNQYVF
ncbi:hypothetical protein B0H17DRAFT_1220882 [Mycena rosella]|uniref:Retrotransposon gag domain-containing protein n=1 Tax=Mycena rosella TaxID=1033263 RepID=A0AAD7B7X4_MYCRO|nr:hypothetical protein B0H17DRAFT_1220882 [Mycena rosella]